MEESKKIGSFMKQLMKAYEQLRGKAVTGESVQFWDIVVISAGDESQKQWYEDQLKLKHESGDLPLVTFLIIPDPPGQIKILY